MEVSDNKIFPLVLPLFMLVVVFMISGHLNADVVLLVEKKNFFEKYNPQVNVAGQTRAGLMYKSSLTSIDVGNLFLVPAAGQIATAGVVCFTLSSRDGTYSAKWFVTLSSKINSLTRVEVPTDYLEAISKYKPNELVSTGAWGSKCQSRDLSFIPMSWGSPDKSKLIVFLNADSTETEANLKSDGEVNKVICNEIQNGDNTAFDTECKFSLSNPHQLEKMRIKRKNFGNRLPDVDIRF